MNIQDKPSRRSRSRTTASRGFALTGPGDVDHLLPAYEKLLAEIAASRTTAKNLLEALVAELTHSS